jgi:hypothetical protein
VKDWNKHQAFADELYGIPKKGSDFYDEVFELFYGKPAEAEAKIEPKPEAKIEPKMEPKMSNTKARSGLYTGDIITLTEEEAALYKIYNRLNRIRSKAINTYKVYDGHPEVDKAKADFNKVSTELRALIKKRIG